MDTCTSFVVITYSTVLPSDMLFMFEAKMGLLPFNSVQGSVSVATFILNLKSVVCVHQCENFYLFQRGKDDTKKWIFPKR